MRKRFLPGLRASQSAEWVAIASRDPLRATAFSEELGGPTPHPSYNDLLADPSVDAVYLPLPPTEHAEWIVRALAAGKHVLCEKPLAVTVTDWRAIKSAQSKYPHLLVMEGFMYQFHPRWRYVLEEIRNGGIGQVRAIFGAFSFDNSDDANIRNQVALGGGALNDIGCYLVSTSILVMGKRGSVVSVRAQFDQKSQVDTDVAMHLDFEGVPAFLSCSMRLRPEQWIKIYGEHGSIEIPDAFSANADTPKIIIKQSDAGRGTIEFPVCDQFSLEIDAFSAAINSGELNSTFMEHSESAFETLNEVRNLLHGTLT